MQALALLGLAAAAAAQGLIETASFGHDGRIFNADGAGGTIFGWTASGAPHWQPQVLSDRVVLTPPYASSMRGALWTDVRLPLAQWRVELEFRASGPEYGGGGANSLQVWYTKQGQAQLGTSTVYTAAPFEGLVLLVDMEGGSSGGGGLRAFLNDGTTDFANHPHVDGLAFGHCDYNYRNLGRPSKITLQQDAQGFEVLVDDRGCFRSNSIMLPSDNYFGITASSADKPDSFEVWKFETSDNPQGPHPDFGGAPVSGGEDQQQGGQQDDQQDGEGEPPEQMEDALASSIRDQQEQFADLHNRLQIMSHTMDNLFRDMQRHSQRMQARMEELTKPLARDDQVKMLDSRMASFANKLQNVENKVQMVKNDQKDWSGHFNDIHNSLKSRHDALLASFPDSIGGAIAARAPNMKLFLFLFAAFQLAMAGSYVVYKRRLAQSPKKYL